MGVGDAPKGRVRLANREDISAILELVSENTDRLLPRAKEELEELLGTIWVVDAGGQIEGSCTLEIYSPKIAELRSLVVRDSSRGLGYGKALARAAVREAEKRKVKEIIVVTSSREFFEQLGFGACLNEKFALFWKGTDGPEGNGPR